METLPFNRFTHLEQLGNLNLWINYIPQHILEQLPVARSSDKFYSWSRTRQDWYAWGAGTGINIKDSETIEYIFALHQLNFPFKSIKEALIAYEDQRIAKLQTKDKQYASNH